MKKKLNKIAEDTNFFLKKFIQKQKKSGVQKKHMKSESLKTISKIYIDKLNSASIMHFNLSFFSKL